MKRATRCTWALAELVFWVHMVLPIGVLDWHVRWLSPGFVRRLNRRARFWQRHFALQREAS